MGQDVASAKSKFLFLQLTTQQYAVEGLDSTGRANRYQRNVPPFDQEHACRRR